VFLLGLGGLFLRRRSGDVKEENKEVERQKEKTFIGVSGDQGAGNQGSRMFGKVNIEDCFAGPLLHPMSAASRGLLR